MKKGFTATQSNTIENSNWLNLFVHKGQIVDIFLTLSTLGNIFRRQQFEFFFFFFLPRKQVLTFHAYHPSPKATICMKCQILFSEKNKKNITNLTSAELSQSHKG